ncbi:hypothetical protein, partial [uncultured Selenomonas sp.]|uniref:hypothetical protein n=1 Tax=uncultured Selenomonas sp. TaxID=159275 RepID=UPI0025847C5B
MNLLTDEVSGLVERTEMTRKLTIAVKTKLYTVYRVRLDALFYNDQNDRIATWLEEYRSEHNGQDISRDDIEAYNDQIEKFIVASNPEKIKQTENNIKLVDQREAGITLSDGRVVDGNRRFTCLRRLNRKNPVKFGFFETVILTENMERDAKHIKMLELMVQHGEEARVDYDPIDRLAGLYNDVVRNKLLTAEEYAKSINQPLKEVNKDLEIAQLMVEYLDFIQHPFQFYIARKEKLDGPLREIYPIIKSEKDEDEQEDVKQIIFSNLALAPKADMTRYMRKIKKILKDKRQRREFVEKQMDIAETVADQISDSKDAQEKVRFEKLESMKRESALAREALQTTDKYDERIRATANREQAAHVLDKAIDAIAELDTNIFSKLSETQLQDIRGK